MSPVTEIPTHYAPIAKNQTPFAVVITHVLNQDQLAVDKKPRPDQRCVDARSFLGEAVQRTTNT